MHTVKKQCENYNVEKNQIKQHKNNSNIHLTKHTNEVHKNIQAKTTTKY
jgi:hypothetical protein